MVGRLRLGNDILTEVNGLATDAHDAPIKTLTITDCGLTNHEGQHEALSAEARAALDKKDTPEEAAAKLAAEAAAAGDSVRYGQSFSGIKCLFRIRTFRHCELYLPAECMCSNVLLEVTCSEQVGRKESGTCQ